MHFLNSDFIALARIIKEWGVKGEMKALPLSKKITTVPPDSTVYLALANDIHNFTLKKNAFHKNSVILAFDGISDRETARRYRGAMLLIPRDSFPLDDGEFLYEDIIGLTVFTTDGDLIGEVKDILATGSNDVYVVGKDDKEYLIPAINDVIKQIDIVNKRIIISVMEGLLE